MNKLFCYHATQPSPRETSRLGVDLVHLIDGSARNFHGTGMFDQYNQALLEEGCAVQVRELMLAPSHSGGPQSAKYRSLIVSTPNARQRVLEKDHRIG